MANMPDLPMKPTSNEEQAQSPKTTVNAEALRALLKEIAETDETHSPGSPGTTSPWKRKPRYKAHEQTTPVLIRRPSAVTIVAMGAVASKPAIAQVAHGLVALQTASPEFRRPAIPTSTARREPDKLWAVVRASPIWPAQTWRVTQPSW